MRFYVLMESIRRLVLYDTELARAQVGTLRFKLFKVGAVVLRNTRRIRFLLSNSNCFTSRPSGGFLDSHQRVLPRHLDKQWGTGLGAISDSDTPFSQADEVISFAGQTKRENLGISRGSYKTGLCSLEKISQ